MAEESVVGSGVDVALVARASEAVPLGNSEIALEGTIDELMALDADWFTETIDDGKAELADTMDDGNAEDVWAVVTGKALDNN
jgi:hypothetical protein